MEATNSQTTKNHIIIIVLSALLLNLLVETLARSGVLAVINHVIYSPLYFAFNVLIIALSLSVSLFFKRKAFVTILISFVWIALGVANAVVLSYRITPFAFIDLFILKLNIDFLQSYLSFGIVATIVLTTIAFITAVVLGFKKSKKSGVSLRSSAIFTFATAVIVVGFYVVCMATGNFEHRITNMSASYDKYGFVSCFVRSSFERGIEAQDGYCEELVDSAIADVVLTEHDGEITPNIIYVQLESFFDPSLLVSTEFSENPIPNFTYLKENYTSGTFDVAVLGAGTANTEFEVLTSMNIDFFGTGEYPYSTVLKDQTCDSIAFYLEKQGYTNFAIHNNTATFYDRQDVYPNLGFDYFVSSEFMAGTTTTPEGWIKDIYLTEQVLKCLNYTKDQDFVFAVSVQGHGAFPEEEMENPAISVLSSPFETGLENQIEYYVNQLYEMDMFVLDLISEVEATGEPSVIVFYGDHMPSLEIDETDLATGNNYQTEYVIWSNMDLEVCDEDIEAYQITAKVMEMLDMYAGVLATFHQENAGDEDYLSGMQLLQYDLVYGERYATDGEYFSATDMILGVGEIEIEVFLSGEYLILESEDLTSSARVFADGKELDSELKDGRIFILASDIPQTDSLNVKLLSVDNIVLYETSVQI